MIPDPTNAQVWLVTDSNVVRVRTRNERSSMTTAVSTRGITNVYDHAGQRAAGSRFTLSCTRKKKEEEKFISSRQIQYRTTQNAGMMFLW